jgi:hypothetical protein
VSAPLVKRAAEVINLMADGLSAGGVPEVGPWPLLKFELKFEDTVLRFRVLGHPELLRSRAARLLRRRDVNGTPGHRAMRSALKWKPSLSVAKRSARVAQQFLDDGERDNYDEYTALYS